MTKKPLDNTSIEEAKNRTRDLFVFGDGNIFRLIAKASSDSEGWMKSTRAMDVGVGCVVQVTTEFRNTKNGQVVACAEALTFVPNVTIAEHENGCLYLKPTAQVIPGGLEEFILSSSPPVDLPA